MLGNRVRLMLNHEDYREIEISVFDIKDIVDDNGIYEPIPITDELLTTKFGFEQTVLSDAILFELDGVSIYKNEDGTYENDIDTKFEYIHQVQNFYQASTLKELTILE